MVTGACAVLVIINRGGCDSCRLHQGGAVLTNANQEVGVRYVSRDNAPYLLFPSCQRGTKSTREGVWGGVWGGSLKVEHTSTYALRISGFRNPAL